MTTIAELKRAIQVGIKLSTINHMKHYRDEKGNLQFRDEYLGIREVSKINSSCFALKTLHVGSGKYVHSHVQWPKKDEIVFNPDGSFTIMDEFDSQLRPCLTYSFQAETASQVEFFQSADPRDPETKVFSAIQGGGAE